MVDHKWFVLNGGVWEQVVAGYQVARDLKG